MSHYGVRSQSIAVVVPGTIWPTKHWHIEGFAAVARYLRGTGRAVVLAGSASERERCEAVVKLAPGVLNLAGQTRLSELAALIRRAEVCVTNDSGSMHLTVALNRPVVSVFGPTDEVWIGPYRRPEAVVRTAKECAPCYFRQLSDCPHNHACMRDVTPGMVIEGIERAYWLACRSLLRTTLQHLRDMQRRCAFSTTAQASSGSVRLKRKLLSSRMVFTMLSYTSELALSLHMSFWERGRGPEKTACRDSPFGRRTWFSAFRPFYSEQNKRWGRSSGRGRSAVVGRSRRRCFGRGIRWSHRDACCKGKMAQR